LLKLLMQPDIDSPNLSYNYGVEKIIQ